MLGNSTPLHMLRRASFLFFDYFDSARGCAEKIPDEIIEQKFDLSSNDSILILILILIFLMGLGCLAKENSIVENIRPGVDGSWLVVLTLPQVSTKRTLYAHLFLDRKFSFAFLK